MTEPEYVLQTHRVRCQRCGRAYTVASGYPARAPHGPGKNCASDCWELVGDNSAPRMANPGELL